jgi:hypothetical protein
MGNGASAEHGRQSPTAAGTSSREGSRIQALAPPAARKQRASSVSFPERPPIEDVREEVRHADAGLSPPGVTRARTFSDSADLRELSVGRPASVALRASEGQLANAGVDASLATGNFSPLDVRKDNKKSDSKKEDAPKGPGSSVRRSLGNLFQ